MKNPPNKTPCCSNEKESSFPEIEEKEGRSNLVKTIASRKAIIDIRTDSPRNCRINELFSAPSTLRTPTSAARLLERAVDKFIKLMQAINKVNIAIDARI